MGGWVPISKGMIAMLPRDRAYSELEAMYSLSVDYDNDSPVSVSGYASLWGWSRKRVGNFLEKHGITISSEGKTNQYNTGKIYPNGGYKQGSKLDSSNVTSKEQAQFIDYKGLSRQENKQSSKQGYKQGSKQGSTTIEPEPEPKKNIVRAEHKTTAQTMFEVALLRRNQKTTPQKMATWANTIRLMEERDGISLSEIDNALEWYRHHWNDQYVPVIESATSLRDKWSKLVNAIERNGGSTKGGSEWI